jgi:hypothetical protein
MTTLALSPSSGFVPLDTSRGVSADAQRAFQAAKQLLLAVKLEPASALSALQSELLTMGAEVGISKGVLANALDFACLLPTDLKAPEVSVDPDGEVSFDWGSERGIVSVSVGPTGRIVYAAELDEEPTSGTAQLDGELPRPLRACLSYFRPS